MDAMSLREAPTAFRTDTLAMPLVLEMVQAALEWPLVLPCEELTVYALLPHSASRYDRRRRWLVPVQPRDLRQLVAAAPLGAAPLILLYVADLLRMQVHAEEHGACAGPDLRALARKVAEGCRSAGLACTSQPVEDGLRLGRALGLRPTQAIRLVQGIGYQHAEARCAA